MQKAYSEPCKTFKFGPVKIFGDWKLLTVSTKPCSEYASGCAQALFNVNYKNMISFD